MSNTMLCNSCGRELTPEQCRNIPTLIRYLAAGGMAFVHGGMWVMEGLSKPVCARCRTKIISAIFIGIFVELTIVVFLVHLWLKLQ